jgi:hypothetical protein
VSKDDIHPDMDVSLYEDDGELRLEGTAWVACPYCDCRIWEADVEESLEIADAFGPIPDDHEVEYDVTEEDVKEDLSVGSARRPGCPGLEPEITEFFIKAECTVRRSVWDADGEEAPDLTEDLDFTLTWEAQETDFAKCD